MTFNEYNLKDYLIKALGSINFITPTKIQELVIPKVLKNKSVLVQSATGSGKTHSFLIPILENLDENRDETQVVIISPTRELAMQLYERVIELTSISNKPIKVFRAIGGTNRNSEIEKLSKSNPQIVVGTLGRLNDLVVNENVLKIHNAKSIIIDEADMIFEEKELIEVDKIIGKVQNNPQFIILSATLPTGLRSFLKKYLSNIETVSIEEENLTKNQITHIMVPCKAKAKEDMLIELLKVINPYMAMIFCNTKESVDNLAKFLAEQGFKVGKLHGDLDDRQRKQIIKRINNLEYKYVVASDIAARGIDIEGVSHVINFDLPKDIEFYIHRTGRTARFDQTGEAYSLYGYSDDDYVKKLQAKGLKVVFRKIQDNELVVTKAPHRESVKAKTYEDELHEKIPLSKKVKPGYKKKRMEQIKKLVNKAKHEHINDIYNKRNHHGN